MEVIGTAGKIAKTFIKSKLTPLIVIASLILGVFAIIVTPREEEPQIVVPMIDVLVSAPGFSAKEVEERVTKPMEKFLWEIKGVEYIYSISRPGMSMAIVRFYVGEDMEKSLVKLYNKLWSNFDKIPPGVSQPIVKPKSIDDVPILSFTLWSDRYTGYELRRVAVEVADELKKDNDISEFTIIGGQRRQVKISLEPSRLRAYNISPLQITAMLQKANFILPSGAFSTLNKELLVETGGFLKDAQEVGNIVVGIFNGRPIYLREVAKITDAPEEPANYVFMGFGPSAENISNQESGVKNLKNGQYEAVTIAIAKKKGTNATHIAERAIKKIEAIRGSIIPSDIEITTTRNYGDTAKEKSDELLEHMFIAAISVTILIAIALGWRESIVVGVAVPVTLALTILINYMYGYTLNRVTLFALIFSIGILVDDAIVVVENIHRHFKIGSISPETAVLAVDEVGNPTILATFTVIAALLPMAFVSGLMGPYMRPIPVGASSAMLLSLLIAFIISPWLSYIVLKDTKHDDKGEKENKILGALNKVYEKNLRGLLENGKKRIAFFGFVMLLLGAAFILVPLKLVTVKMLPFDNKSELQVIIDMPEGTTLEETAALTRQIGEYLKTVPEVTNYQAYVGTAAPFNFNGLVRHYFMRSGSNTADIQVNFVPKDKRKTQSHDIAKRLRPDIKKIGDNYNAKIKIVEIPPGPPVLSTLVAEIYGPDFNRQIEIARQIKDIFENTKGVVDVDWYVEDEQKKLIFDVDKEKAAYHGIDTEKIAQTLNIALNGASAGLTHIEKDKEPVELYMKAPISQRTGISDLREITVSSPSGVQVPIAELVKVKEGVQDKTIYRKNLKRVVYVIGDVSGSEESPVYAILKMKDAIKKLRLPEGYELKQYSATQPWLEDKYSMKWDGEWHITYEVFRDLGIAFAAVLILIYVMVVGWFKSFITPLVIMAPIPLSLVGILPGHAVMGAFFTATSMIGFIAGAGIVVRNSIILVDFIELKLSEGVPLKEAVIQAGIIRFRPMLLTAAAVVVGSSVILFDPIFQGMAISLMAGEVAATLLSRTMVPVLYYVYKNKSTKE
ncbi:multidrug transporter AcrB [Dissulfurispira thermophila]|uniref:Multidrug transporter AcrB n=1 Tax=Dissulfurispira thermophila TaxID=2715679 RepID=A0A7G1H3U1_9BACT|nr:efflux RND transporter permease subunit [Dissulfurispira thermophila]BCB96839.1 multidrug transporter AcrB [Dissulfurispira thermophila]